MAQSLGDAADFLKSVGRFSVAPFINFILGVVAVVLNTRWVSPVDYGAGKRINVASKGCV